MSIRDNSARFDELNGMTLEWWGTILTHNIFIFQGLSLDGRYARIHFTHALYIEILPVMHNCRLRMATEQENAKLRTQLTELQSQYENYYPKDMGFSLDDNRVMLECDEGIFSIWALSFLLSWTDEVDLGLRHDVNQGGESFWNLDAPLWQGGPPLVSL